MEARTREEWACVLDPKYIDKAYAVFDAFFLPDKSSTSPGASVPSLSTAFTVVPSESAPEGLTWDRVIASSKSEYINGFFLCLLEAKHGRPSVQPSLVTKTKIDAIVEALMERPLALPCMTALQYVTGTTKNPVVRQQAHCCLLAWVQVQSGDDYLDDLVRQLPEIQNQLITLIVAGMTDVWSATRKACANLFFKFATRLPLGLIETLFFALLEICDHGRTTPVTWQQREGAVRGLATILKCFRVVTKACSISPSPSSSSSASPVRRVSSLDGTTASRHESGLILSFAGEYYTSLPSSFIQVLDMTLFSLLADEQLSVREETMEAFSVLVERVDVQATHEYFFQVIERLQAPVVLEDDEADDANDDSVQGVDEEDRSAMAKTKTKTKTEEEDAEADRGEAQTSEVQSNSKPNSRSVSPVLGTAKPRKKSISMSVSEAHVFEFGALLDDYEAEGLLGVADVLIQHLSASFLLKHWHAALPTFILYSAHQASSVRQSISVLYLSLIKKGTSAEGGASLLLYGLVIQSLAASWIVPVGDHDSDTRKGGAAGPVLRTKTSSLSPSSTSCGSLVPSSPPPPGDAKVKGAPRTDPLSSPTSPSASMSTSTSASASASALGLGRSFGASLPNSGSSEPKQTSLFGGGDGSLQLQTDVGAVVHSSLPPSLPVSVNLVSVPASPEECASPASSTSSPLSGSSTSHSGTTATATASTMTPQIRMVPPPSDPKMPGSSDTPHSHPSASAPAPAPARAAGTGTGTGVPSPITHLMSPLASTSSRIRQSSPHIHSWQWKEGRLLAYELILERLLSEHTEFLRLLSQVKLSPLMMTGLKSKRSERVGGAISASLDDFDIKLSRYRRRGEGSRVAGFMDSPTRVGRGRRFSESPIGKNPGKKYSLTPDIRATRASIPLMSASVSDAQFSDSNNNMSTPTRANRRSSSLTVGTSNHPVDLDGGASSMSVISESDPSTSSTVSLVQDDMTRGNMFSPFERVRQLRRSQRVSQTVKLSSKAKSRFPNSLISETDDGSSLPFAVVTKDDRDDDDSNVGVVSESVHTSQSCSRHGGGMDVVVRKDDEGGGALDKNGHGGGGEGGGGGGGEAVSSRDAVSDLENSSSSSSVSVKGRNQIASMSALERIRSLDLNIPGVSGRASSVHSSSHHGDAWRKLSPAEPGEVSGTTPTAYTPVNAQQLFDTLQNRPLSLVRASPMFRSKWAKKYGPLSTSGGHLRRTSKFTFSPRDTPVARDYRPPLTRAVSSPTGSMLQPSFDTLVKKLTKDNDGVAPSETQVDAAVNAYHAPSSSSGAPVSPSDTYKHLHLDVASPERGERDPISVHSTLTTPIADTSTSSSTLKFVLPPLAFPNMPAPDFFEDKPAANQCIECFLEEKAMALNLSNFSVLLHHMLVHTAECCLSARFELRRMADQVMPLLIQVICWFDVSLLERIWASYIPSQSAFLHCVSCLSLKYVLRTTAELARAVETEKDKSGMASVKAVASRKGSVFHDDVPVKTTEISVETTAPQYMSPLVERITALIPCIHACVVHLCVSSSSDRLITLNTEILVLLHAHFLGEPLTVASTSSSSSPRPCVEAWGDGSQVRSLSSEDDVGDLPSLSPPRDGNASNDCGGSSSSLVLDMDLSVLLVVHRLLKIRRFITGTRTLRGVSRSRTRTSGNPAAQRVEQWLLSCTHDLFPLFILSCSTKQKLWLIQFLVSYLSHADCDSDVRSSLWMTLTRILESFLGIPPVSVQAKANPPLRSLARSGLLSAQQRSKQKQFMNALSSPSSSSTVLSSSSSSSLSVVPFFSPPPTPGTASLSLLTDLPHADLQTSCEAMMRFVLNHIRLVTPSFMMRKSLFYIVRLLLRLVPDLRYFPLVISCLCDVYKSLSKCTGLASVPVINDSAKTSIVTYLEANASPFALFLQAQNDTSISGGDAGKEASVHQDDSSDRSVSRGHEGSAHRSSFVIALNDKKVVALDSIHGDHVSPASPRGANSAHTTQNLSDESPSDGTGSRDDDEEGSDWDDWDDDDDEILDEDEGSEMWFVEFGIFLHDVYDAFPPSSSRKPCFYKDGNPLQVPLSERGSLVACLDGAERSSCSSVSVEERNLLWWLLDIYVKKEKNK